MTGTGLPHSEIPGSKRACRSPRLIAACRVLHRLLSPRHPSCALTSLTTKNPSASTAADSVTAIRTRVAHAPPEGGIYRTRIPEGVLADTCHCACARPLPAASTPARALRAGVSTPGAGRTTHPFNYPAVMPVQLSKSRPATGLRPGRVPSISPLAGPSSGSTPAVACLWRTDGTPRVPEIPRLPGVCPETCRSPPRRSGTLMVGVPGVEPGTSSLSGTRSNQLSYTPRRFLPPSAPPRLALSRPGPWAWRPGPVLAVQGWVRERWWSRGDSNP